MAASPCLQVDLHRVSELLNVPQEQLEASLEASVHPVGDRHADICQWRASCTAPVPFHNPAEDSDSSFGSWNGQSLLQALLGSPQEVEYTGYSGFNPHAADCHGTFHRFDQFLTEPFAQGKPLPIASARVEVSDTSPDARVFVAVKYTEPILAWMLLLVGIVGWSSAGPTYLLLPKHLQHRSLRVSAWRYGGGLLPFTVFAAWKWWQGDMRAEIRRHVLVPWRWPQYGALALSIFGGYVCYGLAVTYCRGLALAAGMSTINPFLQLLWDRANGKWLGPVHVASLGLAAVAVITMLVADGLQSIHGIAWAVASAMCYVVYVQWSDTLTEQVPFFLLMMVTFAIGTLLSIIATFWFEGTTLLPGPESLFGFLDSHHVFWVVVLVDAMFVVGISGLTGCLKHVPPLVVAVAISLEPAFAITMAALGDEEGLPGPLMLVGVAILFVGSVTLGTVVTLEGKAEVKVDITDATTWR
eukprot:GGOE01041507.1.p1 GENE.GGOE01041507.1~~GGOE01041507.1.p1  ORF type:complete len:537 (-),score=121.38 GGOE01041507.1:239-1648(-)